MKKIILVLVLLPFLSIAQIGINTTTPKAALDIESTDNGILIPRVQLTSSLDITTVVNPNAGPLETSTLVYNIADAGTAPNNVVAGFYYWNGSQWSAVTSNSDWKLEGNTAINSPVNPVTYGASTIGATENFIGTKDNNDVVVATNNIERLRVKNTTGNVGIGTSNPTKKLDIVAPNNEIGLQLLSGNNSELSYLSIGRAFEYAQIGACITSRFFLDALDGDMAIKNFGAGKILLGASVNTNADMSIVPGGNVGIGTVTPNLARFQVDGMVGNTTALFRGNSTTSQGIAIAADWPGLYFNCYYNGGQRAMAPNGFPSIINSDQGSGGLTFHTSNIANTVVNALLPANVPERMRITGNGYVGIGTPVPSSKLTVETIDENTGITNNLIKNTNTGTSYNIDNNITINNSNQAYGIRNSFLGTGSGLKIGALNTASAGILGSKIGFENNLQAAGSNYLFGFKNTLTHTGSDLTLGLYNQINNPLGSTGTTHGIENRITNNSTLEATGVFTEINSPDGGSGETFGMQNLIGGRKTGNKIGVRNEITTDVPGILIGVNSRIISSPGVSSSLWGSMNELFVYADSGGIGTINNLYGNTNSSLTGVVNYIDNGINVTDPNYIMVGTSNYLRGLSNANKYGTSTTIETTAGGTHYGIHSTVLKPGANNFAGYFLGNVGIGTATTNTYTFPPSRGTNGQIMQTDGAGNLSWQNPATIIGNSAWSLTGNSITAGTHFIGSTNNVDVSFRRNGTNIGYLGEYNLAFGIGALQPSAGVYNVAVGVNALAALTAADQNVAIGWNALSNVTTGGNNIGIGTGATVPVGANNNQIRMGNVNIGYAGIQVAWSVTSDSRWKENIKPSNLGLDFINKLNPVFYTRKNDETKKTEYGFIAQELDKTLNEAGATNNGIITKDDEGLLSVRYNDLIAPMVKAIQELKEENNAIKKENQELLERLKKIEEKLKL